MNARKLAAVLFAILTLTPAISFAPASAARAPETTAPEPFFVVDPDVGTTATTFTLDPRGSSVPIGTTITIEWGDGTTSVGTRDAAGYRIADPAGVVQTDARLFPLTHTYQTAGDKGIKLRLSHPTLGTATAYAQIRVAGLEPAAVSAREAKTLAYSYITPNDAVDVNQAAPLGGALAPGLLVALVAGLEPSVLPAPGQLNLSYEVCSPAGCSRTGLENASDPDGTSTSAFTVILQKALKGDFVLLDVASAADGSVEMPTLTAALARAADLSPRVIVSLLPPETGFAYKQNGTVAADPYGVLGSVSPPDHRHHNDLEAFWLAMSANLARYDMGGEGHAYPPPNGFNDSAPLAGHGGHGTSGHGGHDHGAGGGHSSGGHGGHGGGAHGGHGHGHGLYGPGTGSDACYPVPPTGPRLGRLGTPFPSIQEYEVYERGIKLLHAIDESDLSILPRVEAAALETQAHHILERACLELAMSTLAHRGIPVIVPAGDHATHLDASFPQWATWDLQSIADLAAMPQVITVGGTIRERDGETGEPKRVMLPWSAAGPTPGLYGVKPDLVAPADIPVPLVGAMSPEGTRQPTRFRFEERFAYDETDGVLVGPPGNAQVSGEMLRVTPATSVATGITYTQPYALPASPTLNATIDFDELTLEAGNYHLFALQDGTGLSVSNGFGIWFWNTEEGIEAYPFVPDPLGLGVTIADFSDVIQTNGDTGPAPATFPHGAKIRVAISDQGTRAGGPIQNTRLVQFTMTDMTNGAPQTVVRDARASHDGALCTCLHLTFLSSGTQGNPAQPVTVDDIQARGFGGIADEEYAPGLPMANPVLRPTTRISAAYVSAIALLEGFASGESGDVHALQHLRGRLASLAVPLPDVPVAVQGAGELNLENHDANGIVVTLLEHVPHVGGVDFGLRTPSEAGIPGAPLNVSIEFTSSAFAQSTWSEAEISPRTEGLVWRKIDHAGTVTVVTDRNHPILTHDVLKDGTSRTLNLTLASLPPGAPGIYETHLPIDVHIQTLVSPFWRTYTLPIVVTEGFAADLDVSALALPDGAQVWLTAPTDHSASHAGHLVHDPWLAGPAANGTVANGRVRFDRVADHHYAVVVPLATSLPVSTSVGHDGGRPRGLHVVVPEYRPVPVGAIAAPAPTPVAYRFLDVIDGADMGWPAAIDAPASLDDAFRRAPRLPNTTWDKRGELPRTIDRALDEPLPLGEVVRGWNLSIVARAPPTILGDQNGTATRAAYETHLTTPGTHPYTSAAGHLDTRPFVVDGVTSLPWARLDFSFQIPQPASDVHGHVVLPLDLTDATAIARVTLGNREHTFPITRDGVWVPASPEGSTIPHGHDLLDDVPDATHGGILSGWGHRHPHEPLRASPTPRTPTGYLLPVSYHDLDGERLLQVSVLIRPDVAPRETALSTSPWEEAPGPRFRLDGAALYAWTSGFANRTADKIHGLDAGPLARFMPAGPVAPAALRPMPYTAGTPLLAEFLELYVRAAPTTMVARSRGATAPDVAGAVRTGSVSDADVVEYPLGRALTPVMSPSLHGAGVVLAYGDLTAPIHSAYPRDVAFASTGTAVWRLDAATLHSANALGLVDLVSLPGTSVETPVVVREPFPDAPDADLPPPDHHDVCLLHPEMTLVVAPLAVEACYEPVVREDEAQDLEVATASQSRASRTPLDVADPPAGATQPTPPATCLDGSAGPCATEDLAEFLVDAVDRVRSRLGLKPNLTVGAGVCPAATTQPCTLFQGTVPQRGALLLLRHNTTSLVQNASNASVSLEVTIALATHPLATLEGDERFAPNETKRVAPNNLRLDVIDLAPFGGERITITARPTNARWTASYSVIERAPDAPATRVEDARLVVKESPVVTSEGLQPVPAGSTRVAGPAELDRAEAPGAGRLDLPRGLDVTRTTTITDKHVVVGTDQGGNALLTVRAGATLTLADSLVTPRGARAAYGIVVEPGATLVLQNATLFRGGTGESGMATIDARGHVSATNAQVVAGSVGIRLREGGTLVGDDVTLARLVQGLFLDGARATLDGAFIDGNRLGVVARNATLEVRDALVTSNRHAGLAAQDSLVVVTRSRFAWNGEPGGGAAVATLEGLDNGRVVIDATQFTGNVQAADARAPLDLHNVTVRQTYGEALRVRPGGTLRAEQVDVNVTNASALRLDYASNVSAARSHLASSGRWAIDCAAAGRPALVAFTSVKIVGNGTLDAACPPITSGTGLGSFDPAWRDLVTRPYLRAGANDAIVLPTGASVTPVDLTPNSTRVLTLGPAGIEVSGGDGGLLLRARTGEGNDSTTAWTTRAALDTQPPQTNQTRIPPPLRGFTGGASIPIRIVTPDEGRDIATAAIFMDTVSADGRNHVTRQRAVDGLPSTLAILGRGATGALSSQTGENVTLVPQLRDRAGNVGEGVAVSVVIDRTPPRAWIHSANPCGSLLGHDLHWRAHDPMVGSGLPLVTDANPITYIVSVASLNLTDLQNVTLPDLGKLPLPRLPNPAESGDPQAAVARAYTETGDVLPELVRWLDLYENLPLWVEVGRFNQTVERLDLRTNLSHVLDNITLEAVMANVTQFRAALNATADSIDRNLTKLPNATPLAENLTAYVNGWLDNVQKLNPLILAVKVEAFDAVGNKGIGVEPVIADVFAPTPLLFFLGDNLRERVMSMVLGAGANVNFTDLHGSVRLFDPDCGLEDVYINTSLIGQPLAPHAHLYPREGRVDFDLSTLDDLFPITECGYRTYSIDARDKHDRKTRIQGAILLDRLAPTTQLSRIDTQLAPTPLPYVNDIQPPVEVNGDVYVGLPVLALAAAVDSRNLLDCPWAAIHEVAVEATMRGGEWIKLSAKHFGSLQSGGDLPNTSVVAEPEFAVTADAFGMDDASLSGHALDFRIYASDEGGNVEADLSVDFTRIFDVVPPVCSVDPLGEIGTRATIEFTMADSEQSVPGEITNAYLLYRPHSQLGIWAGDRWAVYGELPIEAAGTRTILLDGEVVDLALDEARTAIQLACAVYDAAGNGRISEPVNTFLDLRKPLITLTPDEPRVPWPPRWSNRSMGFTWHVFGSSDVVVQAYRESDPDVRVVLGTTSDGHGTFPPAPLAQTEDGTTWILEVATRSSTGVEYNETHATHVDLTAPALALDMPLVNGFLRPVDRVFPAVPTQNGGAGHQGNITVTPSLAPVGLASWTDGNMSVDPPAGGDYQLSVRVCDEAGNCQTPDPVQAFKYDTRGPTPILNEIQGNATPIVQREIAGQSLTIHWVGEPSYADFTIREPYKPGAPAGGIGVDEVAVYARELHPTTLAELNRTLLPGHPLPPSGGDHRYRANLSNTLLKNNTLYRFEVEAHDLAGNAATSNVSSTDVFAWDTFVPVGHLFSTLPTWLNITDPIATFVGVNLTGNYTDVSGGVDSGVAQLRIRVNRTPGSETVEVHGVAGLPSGSYTLQTNLSRVDDGVNHTYCVEIVDVAGNVAACADAQKRSVLLDVSAPGVSLALPTDVQLPLDPWTRRLPVEVTVHVDNTAPPGRAASPLERILFEIETAAKRELRGVNLTASDIREGGTFSKLYDLGGIDGLLYDVRAYPVDAAGNGAPAGSTDPSRPARRAGEFLLFNFDGANATSVVGNGSMTITGAVPQNAIYSKGYLFDGIDDSMTFSGTMGFDKNLTAMAWIRPDAVASRPVFHSTASPETKWSIWIDSQGRLVGNVRANTNASLLGPVLRPGVWVHVAITYDGATARLILNGTEVDNETLTGVVGESSGYTLGRGKLGTATTSFNGLMDEVRIYRRALDDAAIDDLRRFPYEPAQRAPATTLKVDLTPPIALPVIGGAFQLDANVGIYVHDPLPLPPGIHASGVANFSLQTREARGDLRSGPVDEPRSMVAHPPIASGTIGAGSAFATRRIALPVVSGTPLKVFLTTQDNLEPTDCVGAAVPAGRLWWGVFANNSASPSLQSDANKDGRTPLRRQFTATAGPGYLDLKLEAKVNGSYTPGCVPRPLMSFDDLLVTDGAGLVRLFSDDFTNATAWTLTDSGGNMKFNARGAAPIADADTSLTTQFNATWPTTSLDGFLFNGTADPHTSATTTSGVTTRAAIVQISNANADTSIQLDRLERSIAPHARPGNLSFRASQVLMLSGPYSTAEGRAGIYVTLDNGASIVFVTFNQSRDNAPPANAYLVDLSAGQPQSTWNSFEIDLAATMKSLGLTGNVRAVGVWFEKEFVRLVPTSRHTMLYLVDDLVLYDPSEHLRVDLPFPFPYFGKNHTSLYVHRNGVAGFAPGFNATYSTENHRKQALIAPAWTKGASAQGVDPSTRAHGIYVDNATRDSVTVVWTMGRAGTPTGTNQAAMTLLRTGEVILRTGVLTAGGVEMIGLSAGDETRVFNDLPPILFGNERFTYTNTGEWQNVTANPNGSYTVPSNTRLHLRAVATDHAGNEETAVTADATLTVDPFGPQLCVAPVMDATLNGFLNQSLWLKTCLDDDGSGINATSVKLQVRSHETGVTTTLRSPALNLTTALAVDAGTGLPYVILHKRNYTVWLNATDQAGNPQASASATFEVRIKPEPVFDLVRAIVGSTYVDDVLQGVADAVGRAAGDRLTVAGAANVAAGDLTLDVKLDGSSIKTGTGPSVDLGTLLDLGALAPGRHHLQIDATTPAGSFTTLNHTFNVTGNVIANTTVDPAEPGWTFSGVSGNDRAERWGPANRTSAWGGRVLAAPNGSAPSAVWTFPEPVGSGRHWAFILVNATPDAPFEVLRLHGASGAIGSLRLRADLTLEVLEGSAWKATGATVPLRSWVKVEARDATGRIDFYLDNNHVGGASRASSAPVESLRFQTTLAATGELFVDDLGVSTGDAISRRVYSENFNNVGSGVNETDPVLGARAAHLNSSAAPTALTVALPDVSPELTLAANIAAFAGCGGPGDFFVLNDSAAVALGVGCEGGHLTVHTGGVWSATAVALDTSAYTRIRITVAPTTYTVFANEHLVGEYNLSSTGVLGGLTMGGRGDVWLDEISVARGRISLVEEFEHALSAAWTLPPATATLSADLSSAQAFTGSEALWMRSLGTPGEKGLVARAATLPPRFTISAKFHVAPGTLYEGFLPLALGTESGVAVGVVLTHGLGTDAVLGFRNWGSSGFVTETGTILAPGWHEVSFSVDLTRGKWTPSVDGTARSERDLGATTLNRIYIGDDYASASDQGSGQGETHVDDIVLRVENRRPTVKFDSAPSSMPAGTVITGTSVDPDLGDGPDRMYMWIDNNAIHPVRKGARWAFDTSPISAGNHSFTIIALEGPEITSATRTFQIT